MIINVDQLFIYPRSLSAIIDFVRKNGWKMLNMAAKPVVSTVSDSTYGQVYECEGNLIFCKHKPIEINKGKAPPRVCTDIQITCKVITQEEYEKFFRETVMTEIMILEYQDELALFNKEKNKK